MDYEGLAHPPEVVDVGILRIDRYPSDIPPETEVPSWAYLPSMPPSLFRATILLFVPLEQ